MTEIQNRIKAIQEDLGNTAGNDSLYDRFRAGAISAYSDILNIEYEGEDA